MINLENTRKNTKSTVFLLPSIAEGCRYDFFTGIIDYNTNKGKSSFVNTYIADTNKPWFDNHIFVVYKLELTANYMRIDKRLRSLPNYVTDYCYIQNGIDLSVYVFNVDKQNQQIYNLFKKGLYSKFDNNYKIDILHFWKTDINSELFSYLFLTKTTEKNKLVNTNLEYAEDEHLSKPVLVEETIPEMIIIDKK